MENAVAQLPTRWECGKELNFKVYTHGRKEVISIWYFGKGKPKTKGTETKEPITDIKTYQHKGINISKVINERLVVIGLNNTQKRILSLLKKQGTRKPTNKKYSYKSRAIKIGYSKQLVRMQRRGQEIDTDKLQIDITNSSPCPNCLRMSQEQRNKRCNLLL